MGRTRRAAFDLPLYYADQAGLILSDEKVRPAQHEHLSRPHPFLRNHRCSITPRLSASLQIRRQFFICEYAVTLILILRQFDLS
jgi:hypothetical protein